MLGLETQISARTGQISPSFLILAYLEKHLLGSTFSAQGPPPPPKTHGQDPNHKTMELHRLTRNGLLILGQCFELKFKESLKKKDNDFQS